MKLSAKYKRISISASIIVLLASSFCYYFIIRYVLINQLDKDLKVEEQEVRDYISSNHSLPNASDYNDQQVIVEPLGSNTVKRNFSSLDVYDKDEKENITVRQLVFPVSVNGKGYKISILKSQEETEDLIQVILAITLGVLILLLIVLFIINRFLLNKIWRPFYSTLKELKNFNLASNKGLPLERSSITEFAELNYAVKTMADRVSIDYNALKVFTENASHEMQTPLAIINSKLDVLVQDESLTAYQMQHLQVIDDTVSRLSNLVQSLLLLSKIENNQFSETEDIQVEILIKTKLQQFEELIQNKELIMNIDLKPVFIKGNRYLVDILFNNLFSNAIRYNKQHGIISIVTDSEKLIISNTSFLPPLDKRNVFQRFYRNTNSKEEGNGLGLSIIKQICDMSGYNLSYKYQNDFHEFSISFNK